MKRRKPVAAPTISESTRMWETAFAIPKVMAHRIARMHNAGFNPDARDRAEFTRMTQEKADVFGESLHAMAAEVMALHGQAMQDGMAQWARLTFNPWQPALPDAPAWNQWPERIAQKAMEPVHRRVAANAKRLGKLK